MKLRTSALVVCLFLNFNSAWSVAGQEKGGGDIELIREPELRAYIESPDQLKSDLRRYLASLLVNYIPNDTVRSELSVMIANGLDGDIQLSPYTLQRTCTDQQGIEHSASTVQGQKTSPVCFSLMRLAEMRVRKSELVGLAAHEHARHFGFADVLDEYHPIGSYVSSDFAKWIAQEPDVQKIMQEATFGYIDPQSSAPLSVRISMRKGVCFNTGDFFAFASAYGPRLAHRDIHSACWGENVSFDLPKGTHSVVFTAYPGSGSRGEMVMTLFQGETAIAQKKISADAIASAFMEIR